MRGEYRDAGAANLLDVDVTRALDGDLARILELGSPPAPLGRVLMAVGKHLAAGRGAVVLDGPPMTEEPPDDPWAAPPDPRHPDELPLP